MALSAGAAYRDEGLCSSVMYRRSGFTAGAYQRQLEISKGTHQVIPKPRKCQDIGLFVARLTAQEPPGFSVSYRLALPPRSSTPESSLEYNLAPVPESVE